MALNDDYTLAIEMSNPRPDAPGGVALGRLRGESDPEVVGVRPVEAGESLHQAIDLVVHEAGVQPREIKQVAVSLGPGGFTSLRMSVMTAKLLAESIGAICIGVPTADALRRRVEPPPGAKGPIVIGLAWKRDDLWCAEYDAGSLIPRVEPGLVSMEEFGRRATGGTLVADGRLVQLVDLARNSGRHVDIVEPCFDPVAVLEIACDLEPTDPLRLAPIYPRPPGAVRQWRSRETSA